MGLYVTREIRYSPEPTALPVADCCAAPAPALAPAEKHVEAEDLYRPADPAHGGLIVISAAMGGQGPELTAALLGCALFDFFLMPFYLTSPSVICRISWLWGSFWGKCQYHVA